jgi:hypothetical protein
MNTSLKLIAATIVAIFLICVIARSPMIHAQEAVVRQAVVPVVISPTSHPYKVIDMGKVNIAVNQTPAGTLEIILNELGAQGWKVVTTSGSFVILTQ